jgi:signal transduction histidine kinase
MPRFGLRLQILALTTLPLLALAGATLWLLDRGVAARSEQALAADLERASQVFEDMLRSSAGELEVSSGVIVRDPRFFSVLSLPHGRNDGGFRATVTSVAQDFLGVSRPDVFEVVDARGEVVASVGSIKPTEATRRDLMGSALSGGTERHAVAERGRHVLLVSRPVLADGRVVGAVMLGREVSGALASRLRELTRSEVSFVSDDRVTRTTLETPEDREGARRLARRHDALASRPVRVGGWVMWARPLPMAAEGTHQAYVLQRSIEGETAFVRSVRTHLTEVGLALLAAVVLAALFISRHLTRPIQQLVAAASAMEHGDWEAPIDRGRHDEMGVLASRFDDMRRRQRTFVRGLQEMARARNEFISLASHELRTPISVIRAYHDMLQTGMITPGGEHFDHALEAIGRACGSLEGIAESATRMADAGEQLEARRQECALEPLLEGALRAALEAASERRVELSLDVADDSALVFVDPDQLRHAVEAVVRNGIRFTPDGGSVEVRARAEGDELRVEVRDSGVGLSAEDLHLVREEGFVVRESRHHHTPRGLEFNVQGLGLGLPLVKQVLEAHGGRLQIESTPGHGSVFTLCLPEAVRGRIESHHETAHDTTERAAA